MSSAPAPNIGTGPYPSAAGSYWKAGWRGILPLPTRRKTWPPRDYTGGKGIDPSWPDIAAWMESDPDGNIALRMPHNVVGLDVDNYGDKTGGDTITICEAMWGKLPPTWRSTSRDDGISGIRLYRIPEGLAWPGELEGGSVEIIQRKHRYAVVAPSIHPEGRTYRWRTPDGHPTISVPRPGDLPELPEAWVEGLTGGEIATESTRVSVGDQEAIGWVASRPGASEPPCPPMLAILETYETSPGSRHTALNNAVMTCVRYAQGEHHGAVDILGKLRNRFKGVVCDPAHPSPRTAGEADAEWMRSVVGAVGICLGDPAPRSCDCFGQMTAEIVGGIADDPTPASTDSDDPGGTETPPTPEESMLTNPLSSRFTPGDAFILDQPDDVPAIWGDGDEVLWAEGEALMIAAPPGVGKTTIAGQVIRCRVFGGSVLGYPVKQGKRVLYLAMDRPRQIARSLRRHFDPEDRATVAERITVWQGPLPGDLVKTPSLLCALAELADADTIVVDSLKDAAIGLVDDEKAASYNLARQRCIAKGIEVLELHHMVKRGVDGKPPTQLADVYGSMHLTSGVGSVLCLWGTAGDLLIDMHHLKQPADAIGPLHLQHDHDAGVTTVQRGTDLVSVVAFAGAAGVTLDEAAQALEQKESPTKNEKEKARRQLDKLVQQGHLKKVMDPDRGYHGQPAAIWRTVSESEVTGEVTDSIEVTHEVTHPFLESRSREATRGHENSETPSQEVTEEVTEVTQVEVTERTPSEGGGVRPGSGDAARVVEPGFAKGNCQRCKADTFAIVLDQTQGHCLDCADILGIRVHGRSS